jgi:hypothetical protein
MHGADKKYEISFWNPESITLLGKRRHNGKIILKWFLEKQGENMD